MQEQLKEVNGLYQKTLAKLEATSLKLMEKSAEAAKEAARADANESQCERERAMSKQCCSGGGSNCARSNCARSNCARSNCARSNCARSNCARSHTPPLMPAAAYASTPLRLAGGMTFLRSCAPTPCLSVRAACMGVACCLSHAHAHAVCSSCINSQVSCHARRSFIFRSPSYHAAHSVYSPLPRHRQRLYD